MLRTAALTAARQLGHRSATAPRPLSGFAYDPLFQLNHPEAATPDTTPYKKLSGSEDYVSVVQGPGDREFLQVEPEALTLLAENAMVDIAHLLRPAHLAQLRRILDDGEASATGRSSTRRCCALREGSAACS